MTSNLYQKAKKGVRGIALAGLAGLSLAVLGVAKIN
jgi:hypothetical protein